MKCSQHATYDHKLIKTSIENIPAAGTSQ